MALINNTRLLSRWTGWCLAAVVAGAVLIAQRYVAAADLTSGAGAGVFRQIMLVAHLGTLAAIAFAIPYLCAALGARAAVVRPLTVAVAIAFLLLLLLDTEVYRLYRMHLNSGVTNLLFGGAALETFIFPARMYVEAGLVAFGVAIAASATGWLLWRYVSHRPPYPWLARTLIGAFAMCLFGFHGIHVWADARAIAAITVQTDMLPIRYAATAKRFMRDVGFEVAPRDEIPALLGDSTGLDYPLQPLVCPAVEAPPNIVIVMIDSWRYDAISTVVTPNIARFATQAVRFEDHLSGGNATRIGVFSLFYSIPGTYWHRALDEQQGPVFMHELIEQGYEIGIFRSAPLFSPEFDRTVFADVENVRMRSDGEGPADWDRDLTDDFKAWLPTAQSGPFFAFLFYDSPHSFQYPETQQGPFEPSAPYVNYLDLDRDSDPTPYRNRYMNSLRYVDTLVGEVLDELRTRDLLDETLVLITGDHGQEFNDSGDNYWGHNSNYSRYQTGVPLIWYEPGRDPAVFEHRTSHFDVAPTILAEAFDCEVPFETVSVGQPLFAPRSRDVMVLADYNTFAIVEPQRITVVNPYGLSMYGPPYVRLSNATLSPEVIASALEQKSRFFRMPVAHP
jgi:membrane-anchored protein YejM (alkaline phosphatase superfamily)